MNVDTLAALAVLVFAWAVLSGALARRNVTGPLVFAAAGYLLGNADWGPLPVDIDASSVHVIAEVTLALLLFADAARVNVSKLRADTTLPVRLLGIGFPLSVVLGAVIAGLLFDLPWGLALFLGASLAPTDAALSLQVINDERIPMRLRRALNVESGLNDGIATPIVTVSIAVRRASSAMSTRACPSSWTARSGSSASASPSASCSGASGPSPSTERPGWDGSLGAVACSPRSHSPSARSP